MITVSQEERGQAIAQLEGQVKRVSDIYYYVKSQREASKVYSVELKESGWNCSCPDCTFRKMKCKHIWAVEISKALRSKVKELTVIHPVNVQACPKCGNADKIVKHGVRKNSYGNLQQYLCRNCDRKFVVNLGFEKMHASPQVITSAMQLYFSGESLRNTQAFLKLQGVKISHVGIMKWINKYVSLMNEYLEKIQPTVSETWRTDELFLKMKGNRKYLFAVMDDETRFWIAQQVADKKYVSNIRPMFKEANRTAGKTPLVIISDGASNFAMAINDEYSDPATKPIHLRDIAFDGKIHNNKMERMNGELRDREKVMRSLKKEDTPILKGMQIFHNFIREHQGLEGSTPAERAGIKVEGENKWLTLIQNASQITPGA